MGLAGFVLTFVVSARSLFLILNLFQMLRISLSDWHIHGFSQRLIPPVGGGQWNQSIGKNTPATACGAHRPLFSFL